LRHFLKAVGEKVVLVMMPGCAVGILRQSPLVVSHKGEPIYGISSPFGLAAVHAGGLKTAFTLRGDNETQVAVFAGDGATFDIGLSGVSGAAERNEDYIYICYDNEGYMNTGRQRSSATPWQATTTTNPLPTPKKEYKKDIMSIILAHGVPYAATATVAYPDDLMRKARKAKETKGFRFLYILTPCPVGWQFPSSLTIEMSKLAVAAKIFPLYEVDNGTDYTINKKPAGIPVEKYLTMQGRFRHLTAEQIDMLQKSIEQRWNRLQWIASYRENETQC